MALPAGRHQAVPVGPRLALPAIATGAESREYLEVTEGLSPEDVVILTQSVRIGEGMPVEVVKP